MLVVNMLPRNAQVNKEDQLTKETVSVPILLKVMYHIHVCDTLFHILCIFICVFNNPYQSVIIDKFLLHFTGPDLLHLVCGKWDIVL